MWRRILRIKLGNYGDLTTTTLPRVSFKSNALNSQRSRPNYRIDDRVAGQSTACVVSKFSSLDISDAIVGCISVG